ncbi:MAG: two-component regulator propeller domain-containing protein [Pseudomonadota bacterium]
MTTRSRYLQPARTATALLVAFGLAAMGLGSALAAEEDPQATDIPIRFKHLTQADGLSMNQVYATYQDPTGYLWIATEYGLNSYDGYRFRTFLRDREDAGSLQDHFLLDVTGDEAGNIWVATRSGGIARLNQDTGKWTSVTSDDGLRTNDVRALEITSDGHVLVGHKGGGLDQYEPRTGKVVNHFDNFDGDASQVDDDFVHAILPDLDNSAWVGTDNGLYRVDLNSGRVGRVPLAGAMKEAFGTGTSVTTVRVRAIMRDRQGQLWVGTRGAGLFVVGRDGKVAEHFYAAGETHGGRGDLAHNWVAALLQDRAGRIWAATKGGLNLYRPTRGSFSAYVPDSADPTSLSNIRLQSLMEDHTGLLWVGTKTNGLSYFNPRSWAFGHYQPAANDQRNSRVVTSFAEVGGNLWMGTFGDGIHKLTRDMEGGYIRRDEALDLELGDSSVMTLSSSADGSVWVGLMRGGVCRVQPETGEVQRWIHDPKNPESISSNAVMSVFEDSRGVLWAGTFGEGVNRIGRDGQLRRITTADGLSDNVAQVIREDGAGRIWVGTDSGGLNMLSPKGDVLGVLRSNPNAADSLASDSIYTIYADGDVLWVGGRSGLDRVSVRGTDPSTFTYRNYDKDDGLSNSTVYGVLRDRSGQLWLSTNYGLNRFDPETGAVRSFHLEHGLQGEDFNQTAYLRLRDGTLVFGGSNGFNAFLPERLQLNQVPPRTVFTSISKLNVPIDTPPSALENLSLGYRDDVLTIEFAGLDFAAPDRNQYAYRLDGFDADWVSKGAVRRATYTNLDKGRYVFQVRARNADGFWSEDPLELPIVVEPAPWETWWAYLAYVLAAVGALYLLLRIQREKLKREEQYRIRLEHEVDERTHELAERAEELRSLNEKLKESSFTDPLTGLNNRRFLFDGISGEIKSVGRQYDVEPDPEQPEGLVFVMIDLDHFKPVNDAYGHAAGDSLLLQITQVLKDTVREGDWIIRWGGDEFLVVGKLLPGDPVQHLPQRISSAVANSLFPVGNGRVARTSTSIGYARYPFIQEAPGHLSWEQVLNVADHAMYQAKEQRNTHVGFEATSSTLECDDLLAAMSRDPLALVEQGVINVLRPPPPAETTDQQSA